MRLGYSPSQVQYTRSFGAGDIGNAPFIVTLVAAPVPLEAVVVSPGHFGITSSTAGPTQSLDAEQIRSRPQLGEDLFRAINRLPGLSSSDFVAGFHVRGADVGQLYVSFDGLQLHEPFHLKDFDGALSIIDVQAVGGIDLTTSGFTSEYGGRLGSVLTIRSAEPATDRTHTTLGLSVTNVRLQSEGGFAGGRGSWLVSARRGYLDLALKLGGGADSLSPAYSDLFAKATFSVGMRNRVAVHLLRADDALRYSEDLGTLRSEYTSTYGWITWDTDPSHALSGRTVVSLSRLTWSRAGKTTPQFPGPTELHDRRDFMAPGIRQDWTFGPNPRIALRWGAEIQLSRASYDYYGVHSTDTVINNHFVRERREVRADLSPSGTQFGAYLAPRLHPQRWLTAELGLRFDHVSHSRDALWSPRLNVLVALGANTALRLADGRYDQSQPIYALQVQDGTSQFNRADKSEHRVIALDRQLGRSTNARVEVYQRITSHEAPRYINLRTSGSVFPEFARDRLLVPATSGRAQGVEATLRQVFTKGHDWSATYSQARTVDVVGGQELPRVFDQQHTGYVDASYRAPGSDWRFSAAWQIHSGWPEAPVTFTVDTLGRPGVGTYIQAHYGPISALGSRRLPWYHRSDVRVTHDIATARGGVSFFLDVFNVFDSVNPRYVTFSYSLENGILSVRRNPAEQIGRMPSLGITWTF